MGIRTPVSHQPRDDARRPAAGRHAARHGPRLRDVRRRRAARHAARSAPAATARSASDVGRTLRDGKRARRATRRTAKRVLPPSVAETATADATTSVVAAAPGRRAALGEFAAGKTGTTENYGDAWFVGFNDQLHRRGLGRLPGQAQADADRVPRRPGRGRHLPGADLARLHDRVPTRSRRPARRADRERRRRASPHAAGHRHDAAVAHAPVPAEGHRPRRRPSTGTGAARDRRRAAPTRDRRRRGRRPRRRRSAGAAADARAAHARPSDPRADAHAGPRRRPAAPAARAPAPRRRAPQRPALRPRRAAPRSAAAATAATRGGCPRAQKRHGSSTAFVIPMRWPATIRGSRAARRARAEPDRAVEQRASR